MSENKRSFWASIPGLITGLAGLLTGIVGLGTLAVQQGIIGDEDKDSPATTVTAPASGGSTATTSETPSFRVDPASVKLGPAERQKTVKVENTSTVAVITVRRPTFGGADPSAFRATGCNNEKLDPGGSCTVTINYTPVPLKTSTATLVLKAEGVTRQTEVPIETSLL